MMVCSDKSLFACDNLCGKPLPCGNHFCTKTCHPLKNQLFPSGQQARSEPWEVCHFPCEKERAPACIHRFPLSCHPGDCPPCKVLVKRHVTVVPWSMFLSACTIIAYLKRSKQLLVPVRALVIGSCLIVRICAQRLVILVNVHHLRSALKRLLFIVDARP